MMMTRNSTLSNDQLFIIKISLTTPTTQDVSEIGESGKQRFKGIMEMA